MQGPQPMTFQTQAFETSSARREINAHEKKLNLCKITVEVYNICALEDHALTYYNYFQTYTSQIQQNA
jgi:hypothetical protein